MFKRLLFAAFSTLFLCQPALAQFAADDLSGLAYEWRFNEGSGRGVINHAAAVPTAAFNNLCASPEGFFAKPLAVGGWEIHFGGETATDDVAANPNNAEETASRMVFGASANQGYRYNPGGTILLSGQVYTIGAYIKRNVGSDQIVRLYSQTNNGSDITATSSWQRFSHTFTASGNHVYAGIRNGSGGAAADVLVWGFTIHQGAADLGYTNAQGDLLFHSGDKAATWSAGRGITFDGTDDNLCCPLGQAKTFTEISVYCAFRRATSVTANQRAYGAMLSDPSANFGSQKICLAAGALCNGSQYRYCPSWSFDTSSTATAIANVASGGVLTGTDHVMVATNDGTTSRIFIDKHLMAEWSDASAGVTVKELLCGFVRAGVGFFKGDILYMAVYDDAHDAATVRTGTAGFLSLVSGRTSYTAPPMDTFVVFDGDSMTKAGTTAFGEGWVRPCIETALGPLGIQARCYAVDGAHVGPYSASPMDTNTLVNRAATIRSTHQIAGVTKFIFCTLNGTNDVTDNTVADAWTQLQALHTGYRNAGWKTIQQTLPPKLNDMASNAWRAEWNDTDHVLDPAQIGVLWDAVIDTTADMVLGPDATAENTTYYETDKVHWKQAGADAVETEASTALTAVLGSYPIAGSIATSNLKATSVTLVSQAATEGETPYTYQWYRSTVDGFFPSGATDIVGATSLTLNDTGLMPETTYYYILRVTDDTGAIDDSAQKTVTTTARTSRPDGGGSGFFGPGKINFQIPDAELDCFKITLQPADRQRQHALAI